MRSCHYCSLMGLFKTSDQATVTLTDRALAVPVDRVTWIVELGVYDHTARKSASRVTAGVDAAVAEIEAAGWTLDSMAPAVAGQVAPSVGGETSTVMVGVFKRRPPLA